MPAKADNNLAIWEEVKQVPPDMLKTIQAGRLKGKSDINPIWRYKTATELFGPIGTGWNYKIVKLWSEPGSGNQIFAFAEIEFTYKKDGAWSSPIPGIGGAMMVAQESSGLHANDEAYKMAVTDALSVAMKMLGFGADVYAGLYDGSKYKEPAKEKPKAPEIPLEELKQMGDWMVEAQKRGLTAEIVQQVLGCDTKTFLAQGNSAEWAIKVLTDSEPWK